jgi:hypothetical protein
MHFLRDKTEDSTLKFSGSNCERSPVRRGGLTDAALMIVSPRQVESP